MKFGVVFPQTEIGPDPIAVRDYAQAAEGLGYRYLLAYEHVIGANPDRPGGWRGPYTYRSLFHEPFVLFGYLAGLTQKLELVTGILILPQRQTVLVAKQAAEVDVLSGGRLRLGVGIGWNQVEYEALGENFHNRGRRVEEQIKVLRALAERVGHFPGKMAPHPRRGAEPLAGAAAHPHLDGRHGRGGIAARRATGRWLVPPIPARPSGGGDGGPSAPISS
jgi:probable F420-dependent oxidoreductase